MGIPELEEEGVGMGTLPLFELEVPAEELREIPGRREVCQEMTAFMRQRIDGRNVYRRGSGVLELVYQSREVPRDNSLSLIHI